MMLQVVLFQGSNTPIAMKKIYSITVLLAFSLVASAQNILSVSPYTIPATGGFTLTLVGHNTFFLTHPVTYVRLTQPDNSDGSIFTSTSETVISNDSMTATFNISNPAHGGFYNVSVVATGVNINTRVNGVYMVGVEPRRIMAISPNNGLAGNTITAQISGAQMHFMSSTGFPQVGSVQLQSEIDNSIISGTNITYIDTNNITADFPIGTLSTNGMYKLNIDLQMLNQTNRTYFFTVTGGLKKSIISVEPHQTVKGQIVQTIVRVGGRNFNTYPLTSATLSSELTTYSLNISCGNIQAIDSSHVRLTFTIPFTAPDRDYKLTLNNYPTIAKRYAFRVVPPNISGNIFQDFTQNGAQDSGEAGLGGRKVLLLPDSIISITDVNGNFFYYVDSGNYSIQFVPDNFSLTSSPAVYNIAVDDTPQTGFIFGVYCPSCPVHDFDVWHPTLRCNVTGYTYWRIHSTSNISQQGLVTLVHSPNLPVIYTQIAPDSIHGDTMYWNYNIAPLATIQCNVSFQDPAAGNAVWYQFSDLCMTNQQSETYYFTVTCSYDPNDKSVFPAEDALQPYTDPTQQLKYNINFQNTGNDTAFLVTLVDTIDPMLDLSTFEIVGSSHPMVTNIDYDTRIVTFTFENILLPDSTTDELHSHGYARYLLNPVLGIPDSTEINNTAYIYFDFNPYVETNTVTSHMIYYLNPIASFTTANQEICMLECIDFNSTSINAQSWQWSFPGGVPSSSTDENPQGICYLNTGSHDVSLIATNGFGSDTISMQSYLMVDALPPPPVIYISNDTLYVITDPLYTAYQWYDTLGLIPGATNSYYVPTFSGLFGISVYNQEGCEAASAMPIVLKANNPITPGIRIYPNPATASLHVYIEEDTRDATLEIVNAFGKSIIQLTDLSSASQGIEIDTRNLSPGIYFLRFQNHDHSFEKRFVKN